MMKLQNKNELISAKEEQYRELFENSKNCIAICCAPEGCWVAYHHRSHDGAIESALENVAQPVGGPQATP